MNAVTSLLIAGILFLMGSGLLLMFLNTNVNICKGITQDDWIKSPAHDQFKTLQDFTKRCNEYLSQGWMMQSIFLYVGIGHIVASFILRLRRKNSVKQPNIGDVKHE